MTFQAISSGQDNAPSCAELGRAIALAITRDGTVQPQPGLHLYRLSNVSDPVHGVAEPSLCVIAQGAKEVLLGEDRFRYDPSHYLLSSLELPVVSQVVDASPQRPYLALRVALDPALVASVMVEAGFDGPRGEAGVKGIDVSELDAELLDAILRLVRLSDSPRDYRVLGPLVVREIIYRLLLGEQGARLRHTAIIGGQVHRIARAIERLRKGFDQPLRIESLARELGMSVSAFHHHFKAVTSMSPLQFQKQLRLQEARRLMLAESLDAAGAGYRVGYDDASHFSRDYRRQFGEPPLRDVQRLREVAVGAGA